MRKIRNESPSDAKHWVWKGSKSRPIVLGHRGVPRAAQENTMAALEAARKLGIDGVEIDVQVTKDNVVVLFHDSDMGRLTGGAAKGKDIADLTYAEIQQYKIPKNLDATGTGKLVEFECGDQNIPTLEEALVSFPDLKFNVEMKAYSPKFSRRHWGEEVAKVIRKCGAAGQVIVTSFDFFMLKELEKEYPGLQSGWAYDDGMASSLKDASEQWFQEQDPNDDGDIETFEPTVNGKGFIRWLMESDKVGRAVGATVVDLAWTVIDKDTIEKFHKRGQAVGVYCFHPYDVSFVQTPLSEEEEERVIRRLVKEGCDWVETDDPEKMMALLDKIEAGQ